MYFFLPFLFLFGVYTKKASHTKQTNHLRKQKYEESG